MSQTGAPSSNSCGFFVKKKKRFCKMIAASGKIYCGEHATMVYYVENINSGSADVDEEVQQVCLTQVSLSELSWSQVETLLERLKVACTGLQCDVEEQLLSHPVLQDELHNPKNGDSAHKHLKQQSSILGHLESLGLLGRGRCFVEFGAGRGKLSHWIHEALKTPEHLETQEDLQLLLVERCTTRFKAGTPRSSWWPELVDGKHQDSSATFERLHVDIEHLDLSKVPLLQRCKLPLVGVGKHLCGAATDLALRCLLEPAGWRDEAGASLKRPTNEPTGPPAPGPVLGLAVALCCHHRCEWRHYVGQRFFAQRGLGAAEFSAFCRMSSWATCGLRGSKPDGTGEHEGQEVTGEHEGQEVTGEHEGQEVTGEHEGQEVTEETESVSRFLSAEERLRIGRLCKRLIDSGRLHFLNARGFDGKLNYYVSSQVTLENVLLVASSSSSSSSPL
ncbi:hypothetical protein fugu_006331 [Takifugu bimaculatus]|uniref:tRNA:m(4)X modification enzyme TRM13 n=1 Tax=Takifugu bimaculatus TaxID=433685 RepID=A0A4Z2BAP7_9TELE|nr:hypothetical protein fugu_006331 [Takifugu bimaculatus]